MLFMVVLTVLAFVSQTIGAITKKDIFYLISATFLGYGILFFILLTLAI